MSDNEEKKPLYRESDTLYRSEDSTIGEIKAVHIHGSEDEDGNLIHSYSVEIVHNGIPVVKIFTEDENITKII